MSSKKKEKKSFKMPTAYTTLLIITCLIAVLTYVIPAGEYQYANGIPVEGTYKVVESNPQGIWNIATAPIKGFAGAIEIVLFVLVIGGCLGVIFKTEAIDAGLAKIAEKLNGKEKLMIPILMTVCAAGGASYGMAEETIAFYPIIVPVLLAAGYDVVVAVMTIILGAGTGIIGAIVNPFSTGIASSLAGVSLADGIGFRFLLLISVLIFAIIFVMRYAEKVRKNPEKSIVYDIKSEVEAPFKRENKDDGPPELTKERARILMVFGGAFLIMILALIPWQDKFGISLFNNIHDIIKSIPVLGALIGNVPPFGEWSFTDMTVLFFITSIIIGKMYKLKEDEIVSLFISGTKDLLGVALILGVAKGISVVMNDGLIIGTILHFGEGILAGLNSAVFAVVTYIMYIPMSFFVPSSSGLATATMPILAPLADFAGVARELVVIAFQSGAETMNLLSPTHAVLMGALGLTGIPYTRWVKHIIPFVVGVFLITSMVLVLGVLVG